MSFNHRLIRVPGTEPDDVTYEVHEVYYDKDGKPTGHTENPVTFGGDSVEDVASSLERAAASVRQHGVYEP